MGAGFSIKCPQPFVNADGFTCVMPCPIEKKFIRVNENGTFKCVYEPDNTKFVTLVPIGGIVVSNVGGQTESLTLESLQDNGNIQEYTAFSAENDRFEKEFAVVYASIDRQQKIDDAFKYLQEAENARDQSPEAYQAARTFYYTLLKGQSWIQEEKQRVAKAEVEPEYRRYMKALDDFETRAQEQQKTLDVVNGIKDKVLTLRDDFKYSVNTFSDQLEKVKVQIAMENRARDKDPSEQTKVATWINLILNVLLVAVLAYAAYFLGNRFLFKRPTAPATVIRVPAYTGSST